MEEAEAVARRLADPQVLTFVLEVRAAHEGSDGRLEVAASFADEALERANVAGDDWIIAAAAKTRALASRGAAELHRRVNRAAALLEQAGNVYLLADLLTSAAYAALRHGSERDALDFVDRATPIAGRLDNPYGWMVLQGNLGLARLLTGDADGASDAFRDELNLAAELRVPPIASEALLGLAAVAAVRNHPQRAARLVGAAAGHANGSRQQEIKAKLDPAFFEPSRRHHGTNAWHQAVRDGAALSLETAMSYARGDAGA
jgi:non-specific serine/threonine protein kinase